MEGVIDVLIQRLGAAVVIHIDIAEQKLRKLLLCGCGRLPEIRLCPQGGVFSVTVFVGAAPLFIVVGERHEISQRYFMELQIADIDDPQIADTVLIGIAHLLPGLRKRRGIHPLIRDGAAVVVEVIVHAEPALVIADLRGRQGPHLTVVVLAEHADDAVELVPVF